MELTRFGDLQQASPIPANIPKGLVTEWGVDDVRNWLSTSMQLPQYLEPFEGNYPPLSIPRYLRGFFSPAGGPCCFFAGPRVWEISDLCSGGTDIVCFV
jgi:hypothetical protein